MRIDPLEICLPQIRPDATTTPCQTMAKIDENGVLSRYGDDGEFSIYGTFTIDGRLMVKDRVFHRLQPDGRITHFLPHRPKPIERHLRVQFVSDSQIRVTSMTSVTSATQEEDGTWRIDGPERKSGVVTLENDGTLTGEGLHLPHKVIGIRPDNMRFATFATIVSIAMLPSARENRDVGTPRPAEKDESPVDRAE